MTKTATSLDLEFVRFAGEMAEDFSFNKSLGQIYGLLYLRATPLSLSDICETLSMSKGNASINLRMLESWGAVHPVSMTGTRRDYYEANMDLRALALRRLSEGLTKRLDRAESHFGRWLSSRPGSSTEIKKIQDLQILMAKGRRALKFLSQWFG